MSMVASLPQKLETLNNRTFHFDLLKEITSTSIPEHGEQEKYELPVIGTYVHSHILPGFRYRVRLGGTNEYLFGGKALKLESIGQGYGKRITFESDDILENNNFFWSDSHEAGFAFSPELLSDADVFQVIDSQGKGVGIFSVDSVNEQQITGLTQEKDVVNLHAKVRVCGKMRMLSKATSLLCQKEILLMGEGIVKVSRFSSTLEFLKTEHGDLDSVLHFVKHFK